MAAVNKYGLTPQQEKFALEVAKGKSLAESYRVAYPKSKKWLETTLHPEASRLMARPKVSARVAALQQKSEDIAVVSREKLLREIARLAFADPRRLLTASGEMKPMHELDDDMAAAISSVEVDEYGKLKYKLWDKGAAQEKLAKHLGLYEKDNAQQKAQVVATVRLVPLTPQAAPPGLETNDDDGS